MKNILALQKSLIRVAVALNIYSFASSLVGVFIPLVILQSGASLWEVPAYYLAYATVKLAFNYPAVLLIQRKGARFGMGVSFVAGAFQMLSILGFSATHSAFLLALGAASMSVTNALLWNSQHLYISRAMEDESKSSSIATISIINQVSGVVAPLLGGIIGAYLGTGTLLTITIVLCIAAVVLLRGAGQYSDNAPSTRIKYDFSGAPMRDIFANFSYNIETAVSVMVWPIYLAVVITSFKVIGSIAALAALAAIFVTWLAGRRGDRGQDRAVLIEGVSITSVIDIARIFASSQLWITVISSAYKASLAYFQNAWVSIYYHHAKKAGLQYIMSMEIANDLAYVVLWGVLLIVLLLTSSTQAFFVAAFLLAAIFAWGCLLINRQASRPNKK